jgi:hypothetical protein
MDLVYDWNGAHQKNEINGVFADSHTGNIIVGIGSQRQNLISRPNRNSAGNSPKQIVVKLVVEQKYRTVARQPFAGMFEIGALRLDNVEPQMPSPGNQHEQNKIANEDLSNPAEVESFHHFHGRCKIQSSEDRHCNIDQPPGQKISRTSKQPLQNRKGFKRPFENGRILQGFIVLPIAPFIAFTVE